MESHLHPTEVGFEKAMSIDVREDGSSAVLDTSVIAEMPFLIYAFTDCRETVFRIGHTTGPLKKRVYGYQKVMRLGENIRRNEREDGLKMLEFTGKKRFAVWAKRPGRLMLQLESNLSQTAESLQAEEIFWIHYYRPRFNRFV